MKLSALLPTILALALTQQDISRESQSPRVLDVGHRLELFVDHFLIDELRNARLKLAQPVDAGPVLQFDKPWEGRFCAYVTVIKDSTLFRLYYRGRKVDAASVDTKASDPDFLQNEVTCVAESSDGIHWTKPNLGIYEIHGTRNNNVVLDGPETFPASHNFSPFLDTRPGVPPTERYKGLGGMIHRGDENSVGILAFMSADGIHWKKVSDKGVINYTHYNFVRNDTAQNPAFWSESEGQYVCYIRLREKHPSVPSDKRARMIGRTTSQDFRNWSRVELMSYGDVPFEQLYTNQTHPYFRAPHLYIGLAARFVLNRRVVTDEEARQISVDPEYLNEVSDSVLLTTRGGAHFDRTFMEGFIRPGIGPENWTSRTNYPALNVVPSGPHEMSLYVQRAYAQPAHHLRRYTLAMDRFASVNAPYAGGEMRTKPLRFNGRNLLVNFATSAPGEIRVEIQDLTGKAMPGFSLADAPALIGNEIERVVSWKGGSDLSELAGKPVRLRFVMKDADLYALRFR